MSFFLAIWHSIPSSILLVGLAVLVTVAIASALGFWPVIRGLISTVVGMVPWGKWQTWALIGGALAIFGAKVWLDMHDQALLAGAAKEKADAVAAERAIWQKRETDSNNAYRHQLAELQAYIDAERSKTQAAADKLAAEAAAARAASAKAKDQLAKERTLNVTAEAARLCTLTRGVVLQFNAGAAEANGGDELAIAAASAAGGIPRDAAAGISLDTYTRAVEGAHTALRDCRAQVTGWQKYHAQVIVHWIATAIEAVNRCTVKGASP